MISKTKIKKRLERKTNPKIVETISIASKNEGWIEIAKLLSGASRKYSSINLKDIDKKAREGDTIIVAGKVLGSGNIGKKIRICAIGFSDNARKKLRAEKSEIVTIAEEIKKNPKAAGIKIIR